MGHNDELEEFDAELEIALKREYSTVFPLFRYCVITQEATYLCNKFSMDCVPNSSYLLFEIQMEDVWVWDRNRPTRIIPRAQVYTTADVTIEQLKEGADEEFVASIPQGLLDQVRTADDDDDEGADGEGDGATAAAAEDAPSAPRERETPDAPEDEQ